MLQAYCYGMKFNKQYYSTHIPKLKHILLVNTKLLSLDLQKEPEIVLRDKIQMPRSMHRILSMVENKPHLLRGPQNAWLHEQPGINKTANKICHLTE